MPPTPNRQRRSDGARHPPGSHPIAVPTTVVINGPMLPMTILSGCLSHCRNSLECARQGQPRARRLSLSSCISCDNYELGDFEAAIKPSRHRSYSPALCRGVGSSNSISRRRFRRGCEREGHEHFVVVFTSDLERPTLEPVFLESRRAVKATSGGV